MPDFVQDLRLDIMRGDKIAIIGSNGVGKTTLLRCLIGEIPFDSGSMKWGDSASWSYYPQDYHSEIKEGSTALDWLMGYMVDERPSGRTRAAWPYALFWR